MHEFSHATAIWNDKIDNQTCKCKIGNTIDICRGYFFMSERNSGNRKRRGYMQLIRHGKGGKFEFHRYIRFPSRKKTLSILYSLFKESFCFCFWCYLLLSALPGDDITAALCTHTTQLAQLFALLDFIKYTFRCLFKYSK